MLYCRYEYDLRGDFMIRYKNVPQRLKEAGYSRTRIRKEGLLGEATFARLKGNLPLKTTTLDVICRLCQCKIEDIIEYVPDEEVCSDDISISVTDSENISSSLPLDTQKEQYSSATFQVPVPGDDGLKLMVTVTFEQK